MRHAPGRLRIRAGAGTVRCSSKKRRYELDIWILTKSPSAMDCNATKTSYKYWGVGAGMYTNPQKRTGSDTTELRREAGRWLREMRELKGLSQRQLAELVGTDYYTFVSQLETGRGRIPPDKYRVWAKALGLDPREFVLTLLPYYDPITFEILFKDRPDDKYGTF
jgi:DNA-binding XRE family transcriptional regulator